MSLPVGKSVWLSLVESILSVYIAVAQFMICGEEVYLALAVRYEYIWIYKAHRASFFPSIQ